MGNCLEISGNLSESVTKFVGTIEVGGEKITKVSEAGLMMSCRNSEVVIGCDTVF